jgi:hypothetical protein
MNDILNWLQEQPQDVAFVQILLGFGIAYSVHTLRKR